MNRLRKTLHDSDHNLKGRLRKLDRRLTNLYLKTPMEEWVKKVSMETYCHLTDDPRMIDRLINYAVAYTKAEDPIYTGTEGVWQPLYGTAVFRMPYLEINAWAALSKVPWAYGGVRVLTADPEKKVEGTAEMGYWPDTVKPEFATYQTDSKWMATRWDVFEKARQHAMRNEGIDLDADLRREMGEIHIAGLDEHLLKDASTEAAAASADRTASDMLNLESIDRIISSCSEEDAFGGDYHHWFDPYGTTIDRDTGTTYDSQVLHNSGDDRPLTTTLLDQLIRQCEDEGVKKEHSFLLTGRDTRDKIADLHSAQLIYVPGLTDRERRTLVYVSTDFEGVRVEGIETGFTVSSYNGYPVIVDQNVPKDTISRIYLIDNRCLRFKAALPTKYMNASGPEWWVKFRQNVNKHMYLTVGEVECVNFKPLGKLRDLE